MALQLTITTNTGLTAQAAYHRVEKIYFDNKTNISFVLASFKTLDYPSFQSKAYACEYDIEGSNPIAQAYEYLKTLPEFAGATDC